MLVLPGENKDNLKTNGKLWGKIKDNFRSKIIT